MDFLNIGQVARQAGVGVETIRFYERQGLLHKPLRRSSGYRAYSPEVIARLRFIRRAKDLGFTLPEIGRLLALRDDPHSPCATTKTHVSTKIQELEAKRASLERMIDGLRALHDACPGEGSNGACPILASIESAEPP